MNYKIIILASILLVGCATNVKYKEKTGKPSPAFDIGYSESKIKKDIYNVNFLGNGYTKPQTAREYFLRRSGEIAKEHEYKGFCVIKEAPANGGWEGKAVWYGHAGDVKLTNKIDGDTCFKHDEFANAGKKAKK